jgi:hypothetical protein
MNPSFSQKRNASAKDGAVAAFLLAVWFISISCSYLRAAARRRSLFAQ